MGGTFNPIHFGHLLLAETAFYQFGLDEVLIMPNKNPYYKKMTNSVTEKDRVEMVRLAIEDNDHFRFSKEELNRDGTTYTVETLENLTKANPDCDYYFIMGLDSLISLPKWYKPDLLLKNTVILCASRETDGPSAAEAEELVTRQREYFSEKYNLSADIRLIHTPLVDISSTQIREKVRRNEDISGLVTPETEAFIYKHKLYREQ